jgi:heme-degrading monooxygenase HmoA
MIKSKLKLKLEKSSGLVIIWEFHVRQSRRKRFEKIYGPYGTWAEFFRQGKGYGGTELLRDPQNALRYCTLDFWKSRAAYEAFKKRHASEYNSIDKQGEALTTQETLIGCFEAS